MARAIEFAAQVVLYSLVCVGIAEMLIRRVPISAPASRVALRLCTLALPLLLPALFALVAPLRADTRSGDLTLFSIARWQRLAIFGVGVRDLLLATVALPGAALLARDLVSRRGRRQDRAGTASGPAVAAARERLVAAVSDLATGMRVTAPAVDVVDAHGSRLHCEGLTHPTVRATRAAIDDLADDELRAAVAHELAHVRERDVLKTWVLTALRIAQWFNPVAQVVARRAIQELEWHADDVAVATTARPLALARALLRSVRERDTAFLGAVGRGRMVAVEERCLRLLDHDPDALSHVSRWELASVVGALTLLLFFVQ